MVRVELPLNRVEAPYSLSDVRVPLEGYGLYYSVYRAIVKKVEDDFVVVSIPSLGIDELPTRANYHFNLVRPLADGSEKGKSTVHFKPQEGDVLLVAFEGGRLEYPVFLGYLHSSKLDSNFFKEDGKIPDFYIRSRSGHLVVFDDTQNSEKIVIKDKDRTVDITIEKEQLTIKVGEFLIRVKNGEIIEIKGKKIKLWNGNAVEPAVLGEKLVNFLRELLQLLSQHTHPPNSPPTQAAQFASKARELKNLLSKVNTIE